MIKFNEEMFELLITGQEVILEQPDGSKLVFVLKEPGLFSVLQAIAKAYYLVEFSYDAKQNRAQSTSCQSKEAWIKIIGEEP